MNLQEMKLEVVDWTDLSQDMDKWRAFVKKIINLQVPCNVKNFWTSWLTISLSRRTLLHAVIVVTIGLVTLNLSLLLSGPNQRLATQFTLYQQHMSKELWYNPHIKLEKKCKQRITTYQCARNRFLITSLTFFNLWINYKTFISI